MTRKQKYLLLREILKFNSWNLLHGHIEEVELVPNTYCFPPAPFYSWEMTRLSLRNLYFISPVSWMRFLATLIMDVLRKIYSKTSKGTELRGIQFHLAWIKRIIALYWFWTAAYGWLMQISYYRWLFLLTGNSLWLGIQN